MAEVPIAAKPHPFILWSLVLTGVASISCASILIRLAEAPSLAIAAYRVSLASLVLAPWFAVGHNKRSYPKDKKVLYATLLSGVFLALHFVFWIHSLGMTSVASSATLVSTTPLFVAIVSYLWFRESPGRRTFTGVLCTLIGSGIIAGTDFSFSLSALLGDLLAVLGAVMAAGYLLTGRFARKWLDISAYTLGAYGAAAVVLLTFCFLSGTPLSGFSTNTYIALALLALIPQLIGHTTFNWTLKFLSPTTVAVLILGEPIGATLLAYLVLGETVSLMKGLGLLVLGVGIILGAQSSSEATEAVSPPECPKHLCRKDHCRF
jgi:drug/metabolite transporter (DMT)-like permease